MSEAKLEFAELAKVRPAWVIEALHAMTSTDVVTAENGMRRFEEDPYYSNELSNVTAPDVVFLLELLELARPMCRQLTLLLGSLRALATREMVARWCSATVTEQRVGDYLAHLRNEHQREPNEFECLFLFCHYIAKIKPSPREFDVIALKVLAAPFLELPAWVLAFPSVRRAQLVAQLNHFTAVDHWQFCDVRELATCLTDLYLSDQWQHDENFPAVLDMAARLAPVPTAQLLGCC